MTDQEELIALARQLRQAMVDHDTAVLDEIVLENARMHHHAGYQQPKEEWLEYIRIGKMSYLNILEESIRAEVKGDTGRVLMRNRMEGKFFGMRDVWDLQVIVSCKKVDNEWKIAQVTFRPFNAEYED